MARVMLHLLKDGSIKHHLQVSLQTIAITSGLTCTVYTVLVHVGTIAPHR